MPALYPLPQPFATHMLNVGQGHTLYVEESGNPTGKPALFLHGGPGSGTKPEHRQYFNPKTYRIILFDQRGCGKSTAKKLTAANTTQHLIQDIETIRTHLKIDTWHALFGASWGSTLALAYAQAHPKKVKNLVLSAIFLADKDSLDWFTLPTGVAQFFPHEHAAVMALIGKAPASQLFKKANALLASAAPAKANRLAAAIMLQHAITFDTPPQPAYWQQIITTNPATTRKLATLLLHYVAHSGFLKPNQLIKNASKIKHIPTTILHGELDLCCPPVNATKLHAALPKSTLTLIPACGHRSNDAMTAARTAALDAAAKAK